MKIKLPWFKKKDQYDCESDGHVWKKWTFEHEIKIFDKETDKYPSSRDMVQSRICKYCGIIEYKREKIV